MIRDCFIFSCVLILVAASGCERGHSRPAAVPRSATWVDHTFIDCSVGMQPQGNRCTVYTDDSGEVLADGLFLLSYPARAANELELKQYAAYEDKTIFLQNAQLLMQKSATQRDPSEHVLDQRLAGLASEGDTRAIDCTKTHEVISKCALDAFAAKKPFFARWYLQYPQKFIQFGVAMDHTGSLYEVIYTPVKDDPSFPLIEKEDKYFDGDHTVVRRCPIHARLIASQQGSLACEWISYE
jgi:hypothetical protein